MESVKAELPRTVVEDNYVKFQHEFIEFLFAHLVDMRVIFEGDLDALLILMSISRLYLRDERINPEDFELGTHRQMTLSRIAEITGIPRETVRRKLKQLEERGLVANAQADGWQLVVENGQPVIRSRYETVWQRVMKRLVRLVRVLKEHV